MDVKYFDGDSPESLFYKYIFFEKFGIVEGEEENKVVEC